jgi:O-antigen ligase
MKEIAESPLRVAYPRPRRAGSHAARRQESAGPLATMMLGYIVVVVGRIGEVVPHLSVLPLAKIVVAIALLIALQSRNTMTSTPIWSFVPARLTLLIMMLITVSILFSVLRSGTLAVITGTVLSVSVGLTLIIKAARNWPATRTMLLGLVLSGLVLAAAANATSYAGRAGYIQSLDPNDFAFVMDGLLPIALTFVIASRGVKRLCYLAGAIWMVLSILLTQSRGGLLGLVAGVVVMILVAPTRRGGSLTRQPSARTIAVRALLLVVAGGLAWHSLPQAARTRFATVTTVDSDSSMKEASDGRFTIWESTLPLSLQRPWGWGAGAFPTVDGMFAGGRYKAPHNTLLQALIELGFVGLALVLGTIGSSLSYLARESWAPESSDDPDALERRAFARAMIASLVGLCVSAFFLSELYSQALWTMIALACVVGRPATKPSASARRTTGVPAVRTAAKIMDNHASSP